MRITAGKHKGRTLQFQRKDGVRPTGSRTREALFNLLQHHAAIADYLPQGIQGITLADMCCGTGIVGLEALSRGAASVTFVDTARASLGMARENAETLREETHCRFLHGDISRLPTATLQHQLVVLDPPYDKDLLLPVLNQLHQQGWLSPRAFVTYERRTQHLVPPIPAPFTLLDTRSYGNCQILLIGYNRATVD